MRLSDILQTCGRAAPLSQEQEEALRHLETHLGGVCFMDVVEAYYRDKARGIIAERQALSVLTAAKRRKP